jgi:hypothetical protein
MKVRKKRNDDRIDIDQPFHRRQNDFGERTRLTSGEIAG